MFQEVGAFDAKARLSELLRAVGRGQRYTITVRGKPVADLVPSKMASHHDAHTAVNSMRAIEKVQGVTALDLHEMVAEAGR